MPRLFTVAQLIDRGQKRADMEDSDLLSNDEWKQNLSSIYGQFYSLIVDSGMRYYESEATITADGSATYALPADHLATIGVDILIAGRRHALEESMMQERNRYSGSNGSNARRYALVGSNILLDPAPASGTYYHVYIPQPDDLTSALDADSVDVVTPDGEEFITWGLSFLAKQKEESDVRVDAAERAAAKARVIDWALKRSFITPRRSMHNDDYGRDYNRHSWDWID